jgi:hypothetical protein
MQRLLQQGPAPSGLVGGLVGDKKQKLHQTKNQTEPHS